ncbi:MAG: hypothetical protein E7224_01445 [Clostridiales bacterium]|nr:hypothetical protein [Clostridiales bacterium]
MGALTDWVRNLILMTSAISFAEILLPSGHMGKYLKFILALILLAVLIYPLTHINSGDVTVFTGSSYTSEGVLKDENGSEDRIREIQTKQVLQVYQERMAVYIKESLETEFPGIEISRIDIHISDSGNGSRYEEIHICTASEIPPKEIRRFLMTLPEVSDKKILVEHSNGEDT